VIRQLPKTAAAAMATATVGLNLLVFESLRTMRYLGMDRGTLFELTILLGGLYLLAMEPTGRRCSRWAQGLPVRAVTLWTGHVHALLVAVSVIVLAMASVVLALTLLIHRFDPLEFLTPHLVLTHFARPWLILLAVVLGLGAWRPECVDPVRLPAWRRVRLVAALAAVAALVLLGPLPLVVALFPVAAAGILARRAKTALPPVLVLADRPEGRAAADGETVPSGGWWVVHVVVLRQLFKWPLTWILGLPMTFLLGMILGGAFSASQDADFARYFNLWITIYVMIAFAGFFLEKLHLVDHLPLSRAVLFGWLVLPNLAALLLGGAAGHLVDRARPGGEAVVFRNECCGAYGGLEVPPDLWHPVWGTPPATVTAPWGETGSANAVRVLPRLPLHLWNPYTTTEEASADFVAWQIGRAAADAYGLDLDPDAIRDRYLTTGEGGAVLVKEGGLTLRADNRVPSRRSLGPVLGLLLAFTVDPALAVFGLVFLLCGPGTTRRRTKAVFWSTMGVLLALHMAGYVLLMGRWIREWTVTSLVEGLARRLGALGPAGWLLPWILGGLVGWGLWRLCLRAFGRVEAVRERGSASTCL